MRRGKKHYGTSLACIIKMNNDNVAHCRDALMKYIAIDVG